MKGLLGLGIAAALGLGGALMNLMYLTELSKQADEVYFIGIKKEVVLGRGDPLLEDHVEKVGVPRQWVGTMRDHVELWESRQGCFGRPIWRTLQGPCLLLADDLKTPPVMEIKLEEDEVAWGIPIDTRQFPVPLLNPGDYVSFLIARHGTLGPGPAAPELPPPEPGAEPGPQPTPARPAGPVEVIGRFKVLSLGTRLGSEGVWKQHRIPVSQENVMTIVVKIEGGQPEAKAQKLMVLLQANDFRGAGIQLHPRGKAGK